MRSITTHALHDALHNVTNRRYNKHPVILQQKYENGNIAVQRLCIAAPPPNRMFRT